MVGVQDEVHTCNIFVLLFLADHMGKVSAHIQARIDSDLLVTTILQVVDEGSNNRDAGNDIAGIFIDIFPGSHLIELAGVVETGKF